MPTEHRLLPALLDLEDDAFHHVKKALADHGVNARGWRLYADYGDALFAALGQPAGAGRHAQPAPAQALALLHLLARCEMDVLPPSALLASLRSWQLPNDDLALIPTGLFRAFWKACVAVEYSQPQQPDAVAGFIRNEIVPCAQWYFRSGQHIDESPSWRNAPWATLRARWQQAEHEALASRPRKLRGQLPGAQWPVFIPYIEYEGLAFQALHNEAALEAEGERMSNCVGTYAKRCRESMLRVYAITHLRSGERVGTVSVVEKEPGRWEIDELEGPEHESAPAWIEHAADAIVRSLADAHYTHLPVRREMNFCRARIKRAAFKPAALAFDAAFEQAPLM